MRRRRWLAPPNHPSAVYHCLSRVVDRRFIFSDSEKNLFRSLLFDLAEFCQIRVLTFSIMSNHFHLLVEVPQPPHPLPSSEQTLLALGRLAHAPDTSAFQRHLDRLRLSSDPNAEARWLASIHARRWNLSRFIQALKQRFSRAYNRRVGRKGTLWEERFRSVLVQGHGRALLTMAAYIDLNPLRARIVRDPAHYPWSGYAAALAGDPLARAGLATLVSRLPNPSPTPDPDPVHAYRHHLLSQALLHSPESALLPREALLKTLQSQGRLPLDQYLLCRVRYFNDGAILGDRDFVESIFRACRDRFGPRRRSGARPLRGIAGPPLYSARALRVDVFG